MKRLIIITVVAIVTTLIFMVAITSADSTTNLEDRIANLEAKINHLEELLNRLTTTIDRSAVGSQISTDTTIRLDGGGIIPSGECISFDQFQSMVSANPYAMIQSLDTQLGSVRIDHPSANWSVSAQSDQFVAFWTGIYQTGFDITFGGKVDPWKLDGRTGVYLLLPGNTVTVPSPAASVCVNATSDQLSSLRQNKSLTIDQSALKSNEQISTGDCVDQGMVISAINDNKSSDAGKIYVTLDQIVDQNSKARLRSNSGATVSVKNTRTLIWVKSGSINSDKMLIIDSHEGKSLYLATADGDVTINYPFSGVQTCGTINPSRDFPWWAK